MDIYGCQYFIKTVLLGNKKIGFRLNKFVGCWVLGRLLILDSLIIDFRLMIKFKTLLHFLVFQSACQKIKILQNANY